MTVNEAYDIMFTVALTVIGVCLFSTLIKSIIGPRISDRLVTINMIGTLVTSAIAVLSVFLVDEAYLIDVAIIYVLISFLSVIVFTSVYINEFLKKQKKEKEDENKDA